MLTWIQLSQHAQLVGLEGRTLTVGFNNPGARESFVNGRSDVILQQVLIDLVGQEFKIDAIVDPSAQPGTEPPLTVTRPAVSDAPPPSERQSPPERPPAPERQPSPEATRSAREAIQPTRAGGRPPARDDGPVDSAAHRDDPDADDVLDGAELLSQRLGAQVIEEIKHDG